MLRNISALSLTLAATLGTATPAAAVDHFVMMLGDGFFPDVIYVEDGDRVRFINGTGVVQTASAADGSWTTGELGVDEAINIEIVPGMHQVFTANGIDTITGTVFFGLPPLSE
ncbi:hypothetical protein [Pseudaestuariivita atlantica]|uniref:Copper-binding protein n=1 Tax=Pseudaestuariivita atlantica TaxID=1317121 RepID=A0A0L1JLE8_9RHOB|nr:hypothetical protein [Pseudaestuariivita atlantica]KNG92575.1 hypothetical protein ATO11_16245 [Pseudaestuariivita atlantica]